MTKRTTNSLAAAIGAHYDASTTESRQEQRDNYREAFGASMTAHVRELADTCAKTAGFIDTLSPADRTAVATYNAYQANKAAKENDR